MRICVFAGAAEGALPSYGALAAALGRELGRRGHTLVFGGGARGLMGAAARGAAAAGGEVVGVAPSFFDREGILYRERGELLLTETMAQRKQRMAELADAFVALPGGVGTLEEFFEMLTLRQLGRHRKPLALLDAGNFYAPLETMLETVRAAGFLGEDTLALYRRFSDVSACLAYLEAASRGARTE